MRLVVISGRQRGKVFDIGPGRFVIGRSDEADIQIMDIAVSRRHCVVEVGAGTEVSVRDLKSSNGTFVAGKETRTARLQDGTVLRVGESELTLAVAPEKTPTTVVTAAAGETDMTEFMSALIFCGRCNESIASADVEEGRAALVDGEYTCSRCLNEMGGTQNAAADTQPPATSA